MMMRRLRAQVGRAYVRIIAVNLLIIIIGSALTDDTYISPTYLTCQSSHHHDRISTNPLCGKRIIN
jgi:hypothetical protein